jgi:hypothetical protein
MGASRKFEAAYPVPGLPETADDWQNVMARFRTADAYRRAP